MPISAADAAKRCDVTPRRIQRLAEQGRIPGAEKMSGIWLIPDGFTVLPPARRKRLMAKIKA